MHIDYRKPKNHDNDFINGIIEDDSKIIQRIYDEFVPQIKYHIVSQGIDDEDAKDIIQDGLIIILNKIGKQSFRLTSSFLTYFFGICKVLVRRKSYKYSRSYQSYMSPIQDSVENKYIAQEKQQLFSKAIDQLNPNQKKLINHYRDGKSMSEIAQLMEHKSPNYTRIAKLRCKRKLEEHLKRDRRFKELY